ncbi:MAG TPA: hypothetical protein VF796_24410, partial [Humisphaera sp.]
MPDVPTLFGTIDPSAAEPGAGGARPSSAAGPFAAVAIEQSIDRSLDYRVPPSLIDTVRVGQRVRVPLGRGNKPSHGYVTAVKPTTDFKDPAKVKPIAAVDDTRVLVPPGLMALAQWMGRYYVTPLGQVLECIIPSAVKKRTGIGYTTLVRLAMP